MNLPPDIPKAAEKARLILFLGANDTGKTTLTTALARHFLGKGEPAAVIDADLGQSDIGPPGTIGMAWAEKEFSSLSELTPAGLYYVGSTSPMGHLLETAVGTYRLTQKAKALGTPRILVDTSGLVSGGLGWALKYHKIELLRPDLIIALERKEELAAVLQPWQKQNGMTILRLAPEARVRRRSPEERSRLRAASLARYFKETTLLSLPWEETPFMQIPWGWGHPLNAEERERVTALLQEEVLWAERGGNMLLVGTPERIPILKLRRLESFWGSSQVINLGINELTDTCVGLKDAREETHILGRIKSIKFKEKVITVEVPAAEAGRSWAQILLPKKLIHSL